MKLLVNNKQIEHICFKYERYYVFENETFIKVYPNDDEGYYLVPDVNQYEYVDVDTLPNDYYDGYIDGVLLYHYIYDNEFIKIENTI